VSRELRSILHTPRLGSRREMLDLALSQLAWAYSKAVEATPLPVAIWRPIPAITPTRQWKSCWDQLRGPLPKNF
jgi:hypothetical protein